jgi:cytochrome P450
MLIPKGSIIYQNVFAMHRDPDVYSKAYEFDPDRYIPEDQGGRGEPAPIGNFGFGRRCVVTRTNICLKSHSLKIY